MIHLFAQTTEYAARTDIGGFLENSFWAMAFFLCFAGSLAVIKVWLWPKKDKVPQPLVVTSHPSYADKIETEARFKAIEQKIEDARKENMTEMEKLRREAETGRQEAITGRRNLHKDIESLPMKVIQLLRETKGLIT